MKIYILYNRTSDLTETEARLYEQSEEIIRLAGHEPLNPLKNGLTSEHSYLERTIANLKLIGEADMVYSFRYAGGLRLRCVEEEVVNKMKLYVYHSIEYDMESEVITLKDRINHYMRFKHAK